MGLTLMEGNEAVAWGAFDAGCRLFAGYPITPATSIYNTMLNLLPPAGGVVLQGEDEIASLGYCLGASMAGRKAMTATSGPGISLYSEHISFALASEIPVVVVDVQRLGPSTGYATKGADGDIQFLRWGNSGGVPGIVLAPVDVADCYLLTMHAFNLAERYRCPVFIASSKEIGMTRESVDLQALERPAPVERARNPDGDEYLPFRPAPGTDVPYFAPIGGEVLSRLTSSMHGEDGYITPDPSQIRSLVERLHRKLIAVVDRFSFHQAHMEADSDTLLITYGVTSRAARRACKQISEQGNPISHLVLKTLWPVPENLIRSTAAAYDRVVVVEANLGQYVREIRRVLAGKTVTFFGSMDGKLITPEEIMEAVHA
ncbi:MAG: pyruvate flavodoxin/ferredoxin oxidoreductase [Deltaproteobacteria bacterium]|nr:MAG: pyruvate flavodoxin/ferredoxin oxidoreductase [Deltaproteobacteria bacterium]